MRPLKIWLTSCLSKASTIPYKIVDNTGYRICSRLHWGWKVVLSSDHCNGAVACLTDVGSPSGFSAGVHNLSEHCCGLKAAVLQNILKHH